MGNRIAELEVLLAIEQGRGIEPTQSSNGNMKAYAPPKAERDIRRVIYDVVYLANDWVGRAYIAKHCEVKKTTWINKHIEQLVIDGYLVKIETVKLNGMKQFWYAVPR